MVQDRAMVKTADQYKVVYDLLIGTIFDDLERPLTHISRSRQYLTLNMGLTVKIYTCLRLQWITIVRTYTRSTHRSNFQ